MQALKCTGQYLGLSRCSFGRLRQCSRRTGAGHCCRQFGRLLQSRCGSQSGKSWNGNAAEGRGGSEMVDEQQQDHM